eukprot:5345213-Amphidinium_carterae.1
MALVSRLTQGMMENHEAQMNIYMDDPIVALQPSRAGLLASLMVLFWLCLGAELSWTKGIFTSGKHSWIGVSFECLPTEGMILMSLPEEFLQAVLQDVEEFLPTTGH